MTPYLPKAVTEVAPYGPIGHALYQHEFTGLDVGLEHCVSCLVEYRVLRDGAEVEPEIVGLYPYEEVKVTPWLCDLVEEAFMEDWNKRRVR